jgi:hypothetical protein
VRAARSSAVDHRAGLGQQSMTAFGEPDRARRPVEQLDAELTLQAAHLLAHGRLDNVQALRGAPEVELLGHGDEVVELPEFHGALTDHETRSVYEPFDH